MAARKKSPAPIVAILPYLSAAIAGGAAVWLWMYLTATPPRPTIVASSSTRNAIDPLTAPPSAFSWTDQPEASFPIPPYARFLNDVVIVLDPGHIGQSEKNRDPGWKRGPTGLREAEANFRVAGFLREFLLQAGAKVTLTRDQDVPRDISDEKDLAERAAIANNLRADVLVSIHHNASEKPEPNYTAVFYHADGSLSPASLCVGGHLLVGINDALRLEKHVDCGLWSDLTMYPTGFGLLRQLKVPGVLCESSFHTNPEEERRLRDPVYNRREAYGMFLGLARWAQAGLPRVALLEPQSARVLPGETVTLQLDDGLSRRDGKGPRASKMRNESLVIEWDGRRVAHVLNAAKGVVQFKIPASTGDESPVSMNLSDGPVAATPIAFMQRRTPPKRNATPSRPAKPKPASRTPAAVGPDGARLFVDFQNIFGQHVLHPWIDVRME